MKKSFLLSIIFLCSFFLNAQNDLTFNYKAQLTEDGSPVANHDVTVRFTILDFQNNQIYREENRLTTDDNGIFSTTVGDGMVPSSDFSAIDWSSRDYKLKVEIDTGNGFTDFGTQNLKSVPYAKYADKADSVKYVDYSKISNTPVTFYKTHTTGEIPNNIEDNMYHYGSIVIGLDTIGKYEPKLSAYKYILGNETDTTVSIANYIKGNGDVNRIAMLNELSGNTDADVTGIKNEIRYPGNGKRYGIYNDIQSDDTGEQTGIYNNIKGKSGNNSYGIKNSVSVKGDILVYGIYNDVYSTIGGYLQKSQSCIGTYNDVYNTSNGKSNNLYGSVNNVFANGDGENICEHNIMYISNDVATNYAIKNTITPSSGSAITYGIYTEMQHGIMGINTDGDKYCMYNTIPNTMKGTHYGIYCDIQKTGSYAGYFKGDVMVTRKLKAEDSGDADMKAYVYGFAIADGTLQADRSSDGFTLSKTETGVYKITLSKIETDNYHYVVNVSAEYGNSGLVIAMTDYAGSGQQNSFYIRTFKPDGTATDCSFHFVVYKK